MKNYRYFLIILGFAILVFVVVSKKPTLAPIVTDTIQKTELCFADISKPDAQGFIDKETLRLNLDGDKVTGELDYMPANKDSLTGPFTGTVTPVDKISMSRTANLWWKTSGEGMNTTQELKIVFGEGTASILWGEMVDRGDGVYVYKDPTATLGVGGLPDVDCSDLTERENVEAYVRANITKLSPVKAVLGGTWNVLSVNPNVNTNSGTVMYEDGHIQEIKNFTYTVDAQMTVTSLIIN